MLENLNLYIIFIVIYAKCAQSYEASNFMKKRFSLDIRQKLALIIGLVIFLTIPLFGYFYVLWNKKQASIYLTNLKNEKLHEEKRHAKILATNLALFAEKGFDTNDFALLELAMNDIHGEEPNLQYAFFIDTNLIIRADTRRENIGKKITDPYIFEAGFVTGFTTQEFLLDGQNALAVALPVLKENIIVGTLRLVYSLTFIEYDLKANRKTLKSHNRQILIFTLILTIIFVILGISVGMYTSRMITIPIKKLTEGVQEVSRGNFSIRLAHKNNDEFGILASAFNKMMSDLRITREVLENSSRNFEAEVQSKSRQLKRLQNQLIEQEVMASFGKLVMNIPQEDMIINLLQFVKEPERVNISNYLKFIIEVFRKRCEKEHIKVVTRFEPLPPITSSIIKLNHIFITLMTNAEEAIKSSDNKDKGIIEVQSSSAHGIIKISIKDNGTGITEDNFPKLFEPFFSTKEFSEGIGLGLYVSKSIIEKEGGTMYAYNNKNESGVTFIIELPIG